MKRDPAVTDDSGSPPTMPRHGDALSSSLVTLSAPLSSGAEAIRALRTHVLTQHIHAGRRGLVVCGPTFDVGCTFVATNLAVALAQIGLKTLLVDCDLRAPKVQTLLPSRNASGGLAACMANAHAVVGDFVEPDVLPNLSVLYAGSAEGNAQEVLAGERFEIILKECLRDYDVTIVDTPPANVSADARRTSNIVGYSLVVARRNKSLVSDVKTLVEQLVDDHATVIGTVMNAE